MKFKMIIVASLALGAQFASAAAPSNCAANANKSTIGNVSPQASEKTVDSTMKVADASSSKDAAPASNGSR